MKTASFTPSEKDPFADRRRWTADECDKFEGMGILEPGAYELLDGEIVEKLGQNIAHTFANTRTLFALSLIFGQDCTLMPVSVPISDENRPEPDVFVTRLPSRDYLARGNPRPADMRLVVEVSDTTLWRDRNTKARLYGGAGVPEYWVLDINGRRLFVHRLPVADGYADVQEFDETQSVAPLAAPHSSIQVADLLP